MSTPSRKRRLDLALVEEGHARSRSHARRIIEEGRALIDGRTAGRASTPIGPGVTLSVQSAPDGAEYVSRGAHKLVGALETLSIDPTGQRCLDAGASTGGFTDVLLRRDAAEVVAVDVGHDQLDARLRSDPRVHVHEGTTIRDLDPARIGGAVDLLVADLSFISLVTVAADLARLVRIDGDLLLMVKPQFEVGRTALPRTGVIRDPRTRCETVLAVARAAADEGLETLGAGPSQLTGQHGNREYFLHLRRREHASPPGPEACAMIERAVLGGTGSGSTKEQRG
ncbi:MAG: TlyA family RNA methyltransferase [Brachybacterium sp.]|nr:TlyA family RNA methyltransferase [Brachybacterium sp.]